MVKEQILQLLKQFNTRVFLNIPIFIVLIIGFLILSNLPKPIILPLENFQKTMGWKSYENKEYHFSFKYPDYILSNFQVNTQNKTTTSLKEITQFKKISPEDKTTMQNTPYNVIFEADAWEFDGTISDFIKTGNLGSLGKFKKQTIILGTLAGLRITNILESKKTDVYFYYNLFKRGMYIYNFVLLSDDPMLIIGNKQLLDEIISTATFY